MIEKLDKLNITLENDVNLKNFLSFKPENQFAKHLIVLNTLNSLKKVVSVLKENNEKFILLGNGSNVVFQDRYFDGYVLKLGKAFKKIKILRETKNFVYVKVGAGVNLFVLNNFLKNHGLSGMEFSYGIPASLGGGVIMNCGAFGHEIKEVITSVQVLKKNAVWTKNFKFSYRNSSFKENKQIVLSAVLKLKKSSKEDVESKMEEYFSKRKSSQPSLPSVGSVFKRQIEKENIIYPAKLIDKLSLKGVKIGDAEISKIHAGFIVNLGNATCEDFIKLASFVRKEVFKAYNILLEPEFEVIK